MSPFDLRVISLGAGVQSSTMYLMALHGELEPRPDYAIFADTQAEPAWVYQHLDWLEKHGGDQIPIYDTTAGKLADHPEALPLRVKSDVGPATFLTRDCTRDYKLRPIEAAVRVLLGLKPRQRAKGRVRVEQWIGISLDEAHRAKVSREPWITLRYPLLTDQPMRRGDCVQWLERHDYPVPRRSACYFCPFHNDAEWREIRKHPEEWQRAVEFDRGLRTQVLRGVERPAYLHSSLRPLEEVELSESTTLDLFGNECEGMCGV